MSKSLCLPASPAEKNDAVKKEHLSKQIRDSKRRIFQQVLVKCGQAEATYDLEYQETKARHIEMYRHVKKTLTHVRVYMDSMTTLAHGCNELGEDCARFKVKLEKNPDTDFSQSMAEIKSTTAEMLNSRMVILVELLVNKIQDMKDIKKKMQEREKRKLDYDAAIRKLRNAKEKGTSVDISRRDIKLKMAEDKLHNCTKAVVKRLAYYDDMRKTLLDEEMELFRQIQYQFFSFCTKSFSQPMGSYSEKLSSETTLVCPARVTSPRPNKTKVA